MWKGNWKCSFVLLLSKLALKTNNILSWNFIPCLHAQKVESEKRKINICTFFISSQRLPPPTTKHQTKYQIKKGQKFYQIFVFAKISWGKLGKFEKISIIKTFISNCLSQLIIFNRNSKMMVNYHSTLLCSIICSCNIKSSLCIQEINLIIIAQDILIVNF